MTIHNRIAVILLAAGASSRMRGRDKLLEKVQGLPLLRHVANAAHNSVAKEMIVVLGAQADARQKVLDALPVRYALNKDWETGMGSSIRSGIADVSTDTDAVLILLGDMPEVSTSLIDALITAFDSQQGKDIVRPISASGPFGNPILFGKRHFPALMALTGDSGAKPIIAAHSNSVLDIPTQSDGVLIDLDTPEAWAAWRAGQEKVV